MQLYRAHAIGAALDKKILKPLRIAPKPLIFARRVLFRLHDGSLVSRQRKQEPAAEFARKETLSDVALVKFERGELTDGFPVAHDIARSGEDTRRGDGEERFGRCLRSELIFGRRAR